MAKEASSCFRGVGRNGGGRTTHQGVVVPEDVAGKLRPPIPYLHTSISSRDSESRTKGTQTQYVPPLIVRAPASIPPARQPPRASSRFGGGRFAGSSFWVLCGARENKIARALGRVVVDASPREDSPALRLVLCSLGRQLYCTYHTCRPEGVALWGLSGG